MTAAEKARAEAERRYPQIWRFGMNYAFVTERQSAFEAGAEWQESREGEWTKLAAINDVLTTQLQAAQATIEAAKVATDWWQEVGGRTWSAMVGNAHSILSRVDTSALAEHDRQVASKALTDAADSAAEAWVDGTWHLTVETASWLRNRAASIEQEGAGRGHDIH